MKRRYVARSKDSLADLEDVNRVRESRQEAVVGVDAEVRHVPDHKQLPRVETL